MVHKNVNSANDKCFINHGRNISTKLVISYQGKMDSGHQGHTNTNNGGQWKIVRVIPVCEFIE